MEEIRSLQVNRPLALVPRKELHSINGVLARGGELYSKQRVQVDSVIHRMEATAGSVPTNHKSIHKMYDKSLCLTVECPAEAVHELEGQIGYTS